MATNITGDSKPEKSKLSIGNITSAFKSAGKNIGQKFSKAPKITFGKGGTGTSSPLTSGTDPSKIADSLTETNRILVEIQNQLAIDFANRIVDSKEQLKANRRAISDQKRTDKENKIEAKWIGNALAKTGKTIQGADKSLGSALGLKGGLFGSIFKGLSTIVVGFLGLTAWKFFQNPDNLKRLRLFFSNIGEYTTKAIDWVKTTWKDIKPKLNLLQNLPFSDMGEAQLWIQNAVYKMFPQWAKDWGLIEDPLAGYRSLVENNVFTEESLKEYLKDNRFVRQDDGRLTAEYGTPTQEWIIKELGFEKGGYTGALGGIVHPHEFVMNSDAVDKWGVNLLSSMNEGKDQSLGLGKLPRRTIISYEELPVIKQSKNRGNVRNNEGSSPVTSVPTYSSINPFDKDIAKGPIHYGFAEFI